MPGFALNTLSRVNMNIDRLYRCKIQNIDLEKTQLHSWSTLFMTKLVRRQSVAFPFLQPNFNNAEVSSHRKLPSSAPVTPSLRCINQQSIE